jgi:hypothetical protein
MARTITKKTKREGQKTTTLEEPKKKGGGVKKLIPLIIGSFVTHMLSNVTYMQIVRPNNNGRFTTHIIHQLNLLFYNKY